MSLFGEQLLSRREAAQKALERSLLVLGDTVMGRSDRYYEAETASQETIRQIELILRYFKLEIPEKPPRRRNILDQIDVVLQPSGAMKRRVALSDGWWTDSDGPLLAAVKEDGRVLALLPGHLGGYYYLDPKSGERVRVTAENRTMFEDEAYCFYKPLPQQPLSGRAYILFLLRQLRRSDLLLIVLAGLGVSFVGILTPLVTKIAFASVIPTGKVTMLISLTVMLVCTAVGGWFMRAVKYSLTERIRNRLDNVAKTRCSPGS